MENEIIIFEGQNVKLEVSMKDETVWLNREQLSILFDRDIKTIGKHINNAYKEELEGQVVSTKFATTTKHGAIDGKFQTHMTSYYNLDMIISVGYRVKSKNGIIFRKWANGILKDYMLKGYAVNNKRLEFLEKKIKLIDIAGRIEVNSNNSELFEIVKVINSYSDALSLLDDYDHKTVIKPVGKNNKEKIKYDDCLKIIEHLKFKNVSSLFALERNRGLEAIIGTIYQTYDGVDVYSNIYVKAANFLYFITKNHCFIDGNKRIAAALFIYFLDFYNILYIDNKQVIDNNTLVAITILIAESNPKEKNILVDLVMNFLKTD